jgi:hypothetical protein
MHKLLQTQRARIALLIVAVFLLFMGGEGVSLALDLPTLAGTAQNSTLYENFGAQPGPQHRQGGTTGTCNRSTGAGLRDLPLGTAVSILQAAASAMSKPVAKVLLEKEIDNSWGVVQSEMGFSTKEKAYAFFLGMATRESTLNAALETGNDSAHSYGLIQTAETAYANANPGYTPEHNVPEMTQYAFTPQNFYDPGIAIYMGIRHLIHFARLARAEGYRGTELLRHALIGYNTGYVDTKDQGWMTQYSDEIGAMAGWYLHNGHLYDAVTTWTGDPRVDRSQPWGWY